MPPVSKAQAKAMYAARAGKSNIGIPKSVGEDFTAGLSKGSIKSLPERKKAESRKTQKQHMKDVMG